VTQYKTLRFSKRVKWITIFYAGIPQQVLGRTSTRRIFIYGAVISDITDFMADIWADITDF